MTRLVVLFNLNDDQNPAEYERWARDEDTPAMLALPSIKDKRIYRTKGQWGSDEPAPYEYAEVLEIDDLDRMTAEIAAAPGAPALVEHFRTITRDLAFMVIAPING